MRAALAALLLTGCGAAGAVTGKLTDHTVTATQLRERWGEPCTVEQLGHGEERWTYCVVLNPETGHEVWAQCRPDCEPAHRMLISHGLIVADEPPSP